MRALAALCLLLALGACMSTGGLPAPAPERAPRAAPDAADLERSAKARLELASLYLARGQGSTALEEVGRAIAAKPDWAEAYSLRGLIQASLGDVQLADESYRRALQLAPRDGDILNNHGWFLCQQRRYAEADAQFDAALAQPQYRDTVRTLLAQGVCQARAGRWADAERTLLRSYQLDSANPVVAYNLSDVLLRRGELERARFYVGRINSQPELISAQSLWLAARIERRLGNLQGVQELGRKMQERFPESNEVLLFEKGRFDD
jgi:type IV pilus assembly protein PilF